MPKQRIHEVAKKHGVGNKELMQKLEDFGIQATNHMQSIDEEVVAKIDRFYTKPKQEVQKPEGDKPLREEGQRQEGQGSDTQGANDERLDGDKRRRRRRRRDGERVPRPEGERPPRPDGDPAHPDGMAPRRPRPEGDARPPRPDGERRPPRPDGMAPRRPRPEGDARPPRPDGERRPPRPDGMAPRRPRPEGDTRPPRPDGERRPPRPDGMAPRRPRPEGDTRPPRPDGERRPRPDGERRPPRPDGAPRTDTRQAAGTQRPSRPFGVGPAPVGGRTALVGESRQDAPRRDPKQGKPGPKNEGKPGKDGRPGAKSDPRAGRRETSKPGRADILSGELGRGRMTKTAAKKKKKARQLKETQAAEAAAALAAEASANDITTIRLPKSVVVKELAEQLQQTTAEIIKRLMKMGIMATINQEIDFYIAAKIAEQFEVLAEKLEEKDILEDAFFEEEDDPTALLERPPVVVVMGHVDHGKTSLLDKIRKSSVVAGEAGGITQHIGAYTVEINGKTISFLDTPGHEAFTAMRMRGAQITDIAILVVAADDGVMPQTIEAINHARAAGVEIVVAINKIDRASANPDRVKQELSEHGLLVEEWGGQTLCVPVSAMNGTGIDSLLETIVLVAEIKELRANPKKRARGTVIEAMLDKGRGPVATILVQNGTLNIGDPFVVGQTHGRIRAMIDDKGSKIKSAGPSIPVEILGLTDVPQAGDAFYVAAGEKQARQFAESVLAKSREDMIKQTPVKVSLNDLFNQIKEGNVKELNIVVKADVQGSVEAVKNSLERLSNEEVRIKIIHGGVGAVTESDVMLASTSNAIVIGFNVRPEAPAKAVADAEKVDVRLYRIIYDAINDVEAAMKGLLEPVYQEKVIGHAEIRQIFKASGVGNIGGSYVTDGKITRSAQVRLVRNGIVVYEGTLNSLRRFQDDVREVATGYECAMTLNKFNDIKEGDRIEAFVMEEIPR